MRLGRAIGRYFAFLVSSMLVGIGFLLAAFTRKRQALHDIVCRTVVVNGSAPSDAVVAGGGVMPVTAGVRALVVIVVVVPALGGVLAGIMVPRVQ